MQPLVALEHTRVLYDGTLTDPQLDHPEGLAVAEDGAVWCGGEAGQIYRIEPDGSSLRIVADTGGFVLGLAFDRRGHLYACDLKAAAVWRIDVTTGDVERFFDGGGAVEIPNWPVVDHERGCLYVSDSHDPAEPGGGVWRVDLDTGEGSRWYERPLTFANGMALSPDGDELYVVESFARRVSAIPIGRDGSPGEARVVIGDVGRVPDGLAFDTAGRLYIGCYEPSRVYRWDGTTLDVLVDDPEAHRLCHPTNVAFRGSELLTSNLGRWHVTVVPTDAEGLSLR